MIWHANHHPRCRAPRSTHSNLLPSPRRRAPRRRSCHLAAFVLGHARLGATSCNETAIQRVLPMAARTHKFECRERRRETSQDGGLRRVTPLRTCSPQRQQPPRRVSRPRASANRPASSAARFATNFATRNALAEAPRLAHRSAAVRIGIGTPRATPSATDKRAGRRGGSCAGGLAAGQIGARRAAVRERILFWAGYGARSSFLRAGRA